MLGKMLRNIFSLLALTAATRAGFRCARSTLGTLVQMFPVAQFKMFCTSGSLAGAPLATGLAQQDVSRLDKLRVGAEDISL